MMLNRRWWALCTFFLLVTSLGLASEADSMVYLREFPQPLTLQERAARIGYLVHLGEETDRTTDHKVFALAGKYFYRWSGGYLTHVDYTRLKNIQKTAMACTILDKKPLDDRSESWILVWTWTENDREMIRQKFEPLFVQDHTVMIRIRPEDEEWLQKERFHYSIVEETLLPVKGKSPTLPKVDVPEIPDPEILERLEQVTRDEMVATVVSLQDFKSRYVKEKGNDLAAGWLLEQFQAIGSLTVSSQAFSYSSIPTMRNVVALQPGTVEPRKTIAVCGHMDSISGSSWSSAPKPDAPGADDNSSGSAGVLHIARILGRLSLPYTMVYTCLNAEEVGLVGSKALARQFAQEGNMDIIAVFNMDMIGWNDDNDVAVIGNTASNWLIDFFKNVAAKYTGLQSTPLYDSNIWYSDHSSFWNIGVPAILTIEGYPEMTPHYHRTTDRIENMHPELMVRVTRSVLACILTLNKRS